MLLPTTEESIESCALARAAFVRHSGRAEPRRVRDRACDTLPQSARQKNKRERRPSQALMAAAELVAALEALDTADLAPYASRLAALACRPFAVAQPALLNLPDQIIAHTLSFNSAAELARVASTCKACSEMHVPAAIAICAARLGLTISKDLPQPLELLLAASSAASVLSSKEVKPTYPWYLEVVHARAFIPQAPASAINSEFIFSISVIRCVYHRRPLPVLYQTSTIFTQSSCVPAFVLDNSIARLIAKPVDDQHDGSVTEFNNVHDHVQLSVTRTASCRSTTLCVSRLGHGEDDIPNVEVSSLMASTTSTDHDHETRYYLEVRNEIDWRFYEEGDFEPDDSTVNRLKLELWSEDFQEFRGCYNYQVYENDVGISAEFLSLLRNLQYNDEIATPGK